MEKALGLQLHSCCPVSEMTCSERLGRSIVAKVKKPEGTILTLDVLTVKVREHSSCPPEDASSMELLGNDEDDTATEELGRKHSRKIRSQKCHLEFVVFFKKIFESISTVSDDLVIYSI